MPTNTSYLSSRGWLHLCINTRGLPSLILRSTIWLTISPTCKTYTVSSLTTFRLLRINSPFNMTLLLKTQPSPLLTESLDILTVLDYLMEPNFILQEEVKEAVLCTTSYTDTLLLTRWTLLTLTTMSVEQSCTDLSSWAKCRPPTTSSVLSGSLMESLASIFLELPEGAPVARIILSPYPCTPSLPDCASSRSPCRDY